MQMTIWYFSGSGQGASLAKHLCKRFSKEHEVKLTNITSAHARKEIDKYVDTEQLIIIYPVYANDAPPELISFCESLETHGVSVQLIVLWGRCHKGEALLHVNDVLIKQGFVVNGAAELCTIHSFLLEEWPKNIEAETVNKTEQYIRSRFGKKQITQYPQNNTTLLERILSSMPQASVARAATSITLLEESCTHCGICKNQCPVDAVRDDMSIDEKKCIRCLTCVSACPKKARTFYAKKVTKIALDHHVKENTDATDVYYK